MLWGYMWICGYTCSGVTFCYGPVRSDCGRVLTDGTINTDNGRQGQREMFGYRSMRGCSHVMSRYGSGQWRQAAAIKTIVKMCLNVGDMAGRLRGTIPVLGHGYITCDFIVNLTRRNTMIEYRWLAI